MPFVTWDEKYNTGIDLVDEQHRILVALINELYDGCRDEKKDSDEIFRRAMKNAVDYVVFHFSHEEKLQLDSGYPDYIPHKIKHDEFIRNILRSVDDYKNGKRFVPNNFVRYLFEWLLEHIAVTDNLFGKYYCKKMNGSV